MQTGRNMQECYLPDELAKLFPGLICLVGAGGKTSLLHALGTALSVAGHSLLCTSSTRIMLPKATTALPVLLCQEPENLRLPVAGGLFAARPGPPEKPDKLYGYKAQELDELFLRNPAAVILVEADGAAGRCIKVPAAYEPVIPSYCTCVVAVLGLSCLYQPCTAERVFRLELFCERSGLAPGDELGPQAVARLILHPQGLFSGSPAGARRIVFCNQADSPRGVEAFEALCRELYEAAPDFAGLCLMGAVREYGLRAWRFVPE